MFLSGLENEDEGNKTSGCIQFSTWRAEQELQTVSSLERYPSLQTLVFNNVSTLCLCFR
jgi:hypothetical protein